jgi:hypothetical protein
MIGVLYFGASSGDLAYSTVLLNPITITILFYMALVAYAGSLAFGIPAYRVLRARRLTAFWIAPVIGLTAGPITWYAFLGLFVALDGGLPRVPSVVGDPRLTSLIGFCALCGAIVGSILLADCTPGSSTAIVRRQPALK